MQVYGEAVKKFCYRLMKISKTTTYPKLIKSISEKFTYHTNETVERHIFNIMEQEEEECIKHFS